MTTGNWLENKWSGWLRAGSTVTSTWLAQTSAGLASQAHDRPGLAWLARLSKTGLAEVAWVRWGRAWVAWPRERQAWVVRGAGEGRLDCGARARKCGYDERVSDAQGAGRMRHS